MRAQVLQHSDPPLHAGRNLGWRSTFLTVAALSAVAALLVMRYVPAQPATATAAGSVLRELRVFAGRDLQLALALTAVGNIGVVTVFSFITPLLTDVAGFADAAMPVLLLFYGAGAIVGNFLGGWLSDRALMPSLTGLLAVLAGVLVVFWLVGEHRAPAAGLTFVVGVLAFTIIPGMQSRVVSTAAAAPTLAVAVNASGFQLAAGFAGWLGGWLIADGPGLRSIYLVAAGLTVTGLATAAVSMRRDGVAQSAPSQARQRSA